MRKGYLLVELLTVIAILMILGGTFVTLSGKVILGIGRSYRLIQTNTSMLNMLGQLRSDVNGGKGFSESFDKYRAGEETLLIESEAGVICYQLKEGEIARYSPADVEGIGNEEVTIWPIRNGRVKWQVWRKDGDGYAVEVQSYIEDKTSGHLQKKMANSHLYFVGSYKKARD
jgi:hypothetical protein